MKNLIETLQQKPESKITQEWIDQDAENYMHNFRLGEKATKPNNPESETIGEMIGREISYLENAANGFTNPNYPEVNRLDYSPEDYLKLIKAIEALAVKERIEIEYRSQSSLR